MTKPLQQTAIASLIALSAAFPAAAQNEAFMRDGERWSNQIVDGRKLETRCGLAYDRNGHLTPEFIEKLDTGFFHNKKPGMVALFLGPKFARDAAIRNAPANDRRILEVYASELDQASSDTQRAAALKKVIESSHGKPLDAANYFADLKTHCLAP